MDKIVDSGRREPQGKLASVTRAGDRTLVACIRLSTRRRFISLRQPAGKLIHSLATTLNQNDQQNDSNNTGNNPDNHCIVHVSSPFLLTRYLPKNFENESTIIMAGGPRVTRKIDGKIKKTSGKTSLTVVFAACSSTFCLRWIRSVSE